MVYIPWATYGICKYWMLQRCFSGDECQWEHPRPAQRKWLWDYHTEVQERDAARGIPPPQKPSRRKTGDTWTSDSGSPRASLPLPSGPENVHSAGNHEYGPHGPWSRAPPPPDYFPGQGDGQDLTEKVYNPDEELPPASLRRSQPVNVDDVHADGAPYGRGRALPPPPQSIRHDSPLQPLRPDYAGLPWVARDATHFKREPHRLDSTGMPWASNEAPRPEVNSDEGELIGVSMLDAPPSPNKDERDIKPARTNANSEPLGRTNRLKGTDDCDTGAATWVETRNRKNMNVQVDHECASEAVARASDVSGGAAVTLWNRKEAASGKYETDSNKDEQRKGGYWERLRERQAATAAVKKKGESGPTKSQDILANPVPVHTQTTDVSTSTSLPLTSAKLPRMGATKRLSNGEAKYVGPHPSTIRVSAPYMTHAAISSKLQQSTSTQLDIQERSIAEAREDSIRLQGCHWIDNVRRALQLPIRTYTTACVYYHKFRLAHAGSVNGMEYANAWPDACAASLLTSCKVEDTLKKSRDILAAAYHLKAAIHDQLGADDAVFEGPSRVVIGLERLVLEAGGFDFRSRYPHRLLVKLARIMPEGVDGEREKVAKVAWSILTDLHRTFAPLKQTSATLALASLELAAHLVASSTEDNLSAIRDNLQTFDLGVWSTSREEIMETLLDALDLYTQHTASTILGSKYTLDAFLRIRLVFNKECNESNLPRYTAAPPSENQPVIGSALRVQNGHPTPVSPMEPGPQAQTSQAANGAQATPENGGTLRFMLDPQLATDEKAQVQKYFVEEWEEYEEEIEIPAARTRTRSPERKHERAPVERTSSDRAREPPPRPERGDRGERIERDPARKEDRDRERDRLREREREAERERQRLRDQERDRRYADRPRYDERERDWDRRVDERDRRDREYDERRYEDERRRERR